MTYTDATAVAAIARAIEAEQNFVYAAGLAGVYLTGRAKRQVLTQLADHQGRLQVYSQMLEPSSVPAPPPAFKPPTPITDARSAREALAKLNNALVGINADVAANTQAADRAFAIDGAQLCARAAVQWGAPSQAFPT
jgi:hypothetical protein